MGRSGEYAFRNQEIEERIVKWEFEGSIIGRSKSQQEIDTQIDQSGEEFQKAECYGGIPELDSEWDQYSEGPGEMLPGWGRGLEIWIAPFQNVGAGRRKEERPKRKRDGEWEIP